MAGISLLDYGIVTVYFAAIAALGIWVGRKQNSSRRYFLADGALPTWVVAFTLMGTMIGTGTIVGQPGTVYGKGMILLLGNFAVPLVLLFVAFYVVPFYRNVVGMSAYEYIHQRFGTGGRVFASLGFLADRIFDLGVTLVTTSVAIYVMTGWDKTWVVFCVGTFTVGYTAVGGMKAVAWTTAVQGFILIGGMILILGFLLFAPEAGSPGAVLGAAWKGGRFDLGDFSLSLKSFLAGEETTQWLFFLAAMIGIGRRYICDQHMVQRYLTAKSDRAASRAAFWGALSCVPIWLTFMLIGACLFGFYEVTGKTVPANADEIVPHFLINQLPSGLLGLILSAILAASMSTVSGDLNSVATVITTDYFVPIAPRVSDGGRVWFGRAMVATGGLLATGVAWLLLPEEGVKPIMERGVTIAAIISAGSLGLFFLGFLTRRATVQGCYVGIVACLLFSAWGILTSGGEDRILDLGLNFGLNPILIGVFGHVVLFAVGYIASLVLPGTPPPHVERLTISRLRELKRVKDTH